MFSIFKKIFDMNNKKEEICNKNRTKRLFFTGYEQLTISANNDEKILKTKDEAYTILKKYRDNPKQILNYINAKGTKVVFAPQIKTIITLLGYDEGFIPTHNGIKARILNIIISYILKEKINFAEKCNSLIYISKKEISLYFTGYNLYHWLAWRNRLSGYDFETLSLFKTTFANQNYNLGLLSINEILSLKESLDRDKEACDFVMKFIQEQVSTKERLESILEGKKVHI